MTLISTWDSPLPGAAWDAGLDWDTNTGGIASASISGWTARITSEHSTKPNYMATLAVLLQPLADDIAVLNTLPSEFNVNLAVGSQLDAVGQWINTSRYISTALSGVYFSFDTAGIGFDQGQWWNPYSPGTALTALSDQSYRQLLLFNMAMMKWDGSIPWVQAAWDSVFGTLGYKLLIQDNRHMHMAYALAGTVPDPVTQGLFLAGYYSPKPAGVQIDFLATPSVPGAPYFGFDAQNTSISGFDTGAWAVLNPGM